ncbi:hypothetical protein FRC04_007743 [Tulasnella sp. 424]|nr:hypothetical protein FRC04_007743 [Tulasnella sp. 424]KAG8964313.1 hypothetical protein FRC05_003863 [Tulasnella sp. 425]
MDIDILQSTLGELSHLLIPPSRIALENDVELGVGGYGQVFLAVLQSSDSQTKVAVKELRIPQAKEVRRDVAIRLAREFKVWAQAKHPNILELHGFYLSDDYLYARFVSAYMANGNVKEYIKILNPNLATRLGFSGVGPLQVQGITSGMSYLHKCSPAICHGDLKPANVLIKENLDAVLCDFGLARFILESGVSFGLTTSKTPKGSIRYMAPELVLPEKPNLHTLESDVWAWACTVFEVLTGCEPYPDALRPEVIVVALARGQSPGSVDLLDSLVSSGYITDRPTLDSLKSIIPDCWIMDSAKRLSSSEILDRLISPDGIEALDTATASSDSAVEDRQQEVLPPPNTGSPTHGNGKGKRKGSPALEGSPEKRARGEDAAIQTGTVKDTHILESVLEDLSHLLIPPSHIARDNDAELSEWDFGTAFLAVLRSSDSQTKVTVKELRIGRSQAVRRRIAIVSPLSNLHLFPDAYWSNKRLARELKVWDKAKHPNILALLGFYLSDDYLCASLVSEYMANGNVKEYINECNPDLATRLGFTNVLVKENLDVVLCDFGLAPFVLESGVSSGLTTSKSVKGSVRYMAPELFTNAGAKYTLESDVWAWACTAFEICTSSKVLTDFRPFHDKRVEMVVMVAIIQGRAPGSVNLLDRLVLDTTHITLQLTLDSLKSIIPDCWIEDSAQRPSSSEILDRLVSPDGIEAVDIATASSHLPATEDRQPEPSPPPPSTSLPMHADGNRASL